MDLRLKCHTDLLVLLRGSASAHAARTIKQKKNFILKLQCDELAYRNQGETTMNL